MREVINVTWRKGNLECRGRNDWFKPAQVSVGTIGDQISMTIRSKTQWPSDPIQVHLSAEDFGRVANAIRTAIRTVHETTNDPERDPNQRPDRVISFANQVEAGAFIDGFNFVNGSSLRAEQHGKTVRLYES